MKRKRSCSDVNGALHTVDIKGWEGMHTLLRYEHKHKNTVLLHELETQCSSNT